MSNYSNIRAKRFIVTGVTPQMKKTVSQDRKQKGISESALIKDIVDNYYQKNPLVINPYFLED